MPVSNSSRREFFQTTALLTAGGLASLPLSASADESVQSSTMRKLKITAVKTFLLRHRLKRPFGVSVSVPLDKIRQTLLVKIETDTGLVGWGETAPINGSRGTIDDHLAPRLLGQNPLEHRRLWRLMWGPNFGNALAVGALDMALNDLRGKALNMSVAELFGGRLRGRVPVYASAMNYIAGMEPEDQFPQEAAALVRNIVKKVEEDLVFPGQIKVTVIRETRNVEYAK